jgi:hypothetical protein
MIRNEERIGVLGVLGGDSSPRVSGEMMVVVVYVSGQSTSLEDKVCLPSLPKFIRSNALRLNTGPSW